MDFVFKIFGAPHTFDLYQGNGNEIGYFQTFDNGSKENTKLVIHRMASGKVSYSYLRYNFMSGGGRENSWFGMSVVFDNEYCKDIDAIYELFDTVYKQIILKNKKLIEEVHNNTKVQAKYLVRSFTEAETEIKIIENNIINNLKNHFADDILPLDASFSQNSTGLIKLNDKKGNAAFIAALRKYSWLSISSEYKEMEEVFLSPAEIAKVDDVIVNEPANISKFSVDILKGINVQADIEKSNNRIQANIKTITPFLKKQIELQERYEKLYAISKQLDDLRMVLNNAPTPAPPPNPDLPVLILPENEKQPTPSSWWKQNAQKVIVIASVVAVGGVLWFVTLDTKIEDPEGPESNREADIENLFVEQGYVALEKNDFDTAIAKFVKAGKMNLVENAKEKAKEYWNNQAIDGMGKTTLQGRLECLNKVKKYGGYPSTNDDIAAVEKEINNAAEEKEKQKRLAEQGDMQQKQKGKSKDVQNDCIIHKQFDSANPKTDWTVADLLKEAKIKLDAGSYVITIDMCNAVIAKQKANPDCATAEQLQKANSYITRANAQK